MSNDQLQMLQTQTPEEGFELAIRLAQRGVEVTQPSEEIRQMLCGRYIPETLIVL